MEQNTGEIDWVEAALAALHRITGIQGRIRRIRRASRTDGVESSAAAAVGLRHGEVSHRLAVVCRRAVRTSADLSVVHAQLAGHQSGNGHSGHNGHDGGGLLITTYLTPALALQCREMGLQFIDTAGNGYLDAAGMFVFVSGQTPPGSLVRPPIRTTGNLSSQRMVFTLLCRPALLQATYREIAHLSGIALGSVGAVFNGLAARGWLLESPGDSRTDEKRRLTAPDRLLDEWVANYPTILRPRLEPRHFVAPSDDWWQALRAEELAALDACWGGEVAARAMLGMPGGELPADMHQTIYMHPERMAQGIQALSARHRLKPQPNGPIEILEAFWDPAIDESADLRLDDLPSDLPSDDQQSDDQPAAPGLAPPVLVYADLMASLQPGHLEMAAELRKRVLTDALDQF